MGTLTLSPECHRVPGCQN